MKRKPCAARKAGFADCSAIYSLIKRNPRELVPRSISDIVQNVDRFLVVEDRGKVVGAVAWAILPEIGKAAHPTVEIKSLAVEKTCRKRGLGRALVEAAIKRVREFKPEQIIVLTFTPKFFRKFGFAEVSKAGLMHKLYLGCLNCTKYDSPLTCPEVAMSLSVGRGRK